MRMRAMIVSATALTAAGLLAGCASQPSALAARDAGEVLEQCDQVTGSRIRNPERTGCTPVGYPFKSISAEAIEATGDIDLVEALRSIDPSFQ